MFGSSRSIALSESGLYIGRSIRGYAMTSLNVSPSSETIQDGSYTPLSRPLFMYPSQEAIQRPEVKAFMDYVVENYQAIAEAAAIVPMSQEQADQAKTALGS